MSRSPGELESCARQFVQDLVANHHVPGCALRVSHGEDIYADVTAGVDPNRPQAAFTAHSVIPLYSLTKPITAYVGLKLAKMGMLDLDDSVDKYISAFTTLEVAVKPDESLSSVTSAHVPTLRQCLAQTAGFAGPNSPLTAIARELSARGVLGSQTLLSPAQAIDAIAAVPLAFPPGQRWCYGLSTDVAGLVFEALSGQSLRAVSDALVFGPLNMTSSGFYSRSDYCSAGGGLSGSLEDYDRFFRHLIYREAAHWAAMTRNQLIGDIASNGGIGFSEGDGRGVGYGLGIGLILDDNGRPVSYFWGGRGGCYVEQSEITGLRVTFFADRITLDTKRVRRVLRELISASG